MNDVLLATWISRILRLLIAGFFGWAAYTYPDLKFLYLPAVIALITGFMKPSGCINSACDKVEESPGRP